MFICEMSQRRQQKDHSRNDTGNEQELKSHWNCPPGPKDWFVLASFGMQIVLDPLEEVGHSGP